MKDSMREVLEELVSHGEVAPDHFRGRGHIVNGLTRRGCAEWVRANPRSAGATSLRVTEFGRQQLQQTPGA